MKKSRSLLPFALAALSLATVPLAACSQSQSRQVMDSGAVDEGYPARLALASMSLPLEQAPVQPEGGMWSVDAAGVHFGVPGQPDLMTLSCTRAADGTVQLELTRTTRAAQGAKAMLALIGNGRIARLPVDAVRAGETGEWRGTVPSADRRLDVLQGGNRIEATLPGGGTLLMPASREPGRLLAACRAGARAGNAV